MARSAGTSRTTSTRATSRYKSSFIIFKHGFDANCIV